MHIVARPKLEAFKKRHANARSWLDAWWKIATKAEWTSLDDVRRTYNSADQYERCLIFDALGNRYRLIAGVSYRAKGRKGTLYIRSFLTHAEYNKDSWKKDCEKK
jgi:mRNA interferase HigB